VASCGQLSRLPAVRRPVAEPISLEILVDTDVQVSADTAPKRVVDALRRHLRPHNLARTVQHRDHDQRALLTLLQAHSGHYRLPQGLLRRVTETCQRHGIPYSVVDRRAMVSCPPLRTTAQLTSSQQKALRRLLLHDGGVIVAPSFADRAAVAAETIARRRQRCLVLCDPSTAGDWAAQLADLLHPGRPFVQRLRAASNETRVVVASYEEAGQLPPGALRQAYGLVVFDGVEAVDPLVMMKRVRAVGARYLLGFAERATRGDGLHGTLFLVLGGLVHRMPAASVNRPPQLSLHFVPTAFHFPYEGRSQYQAMVAALALDEERNRQLVRDIAREAHAENPCVVLSERRDHLETLAKLLPREISAGQVTSAVRPAQRSELLARFSRGDLRVILCTSQIAAEALQTATARALFISFPFSYARKLQALVQQLLRPASDKTTVQVYDYDDQQISPLHRAFDKRAKLLERLRRDADRAHRSWAQLTLELPGSD